MTRLANILEIPPELLEAIGEGIPQQALKPPQSPAEADDFLLHMLLEPAQVTVTMSWLVWYGKHDTTIIDNLRQLTAKL